ncbi:transposase [Endozoicomonas gorgoniicola]
MVKPPSVRRLPDILTTDELTRLLNRCRKPEIRTFILTTYSMGLRLSETLTLTVNDIDSNRMRVHLRQCKGQKERYYLFNSSNLAKVFRARLLKALDEAGLLTAKLKKSLPKNWVVNCQHTGKGEPALKYLSRYLYRGVISDRQIVASQNGKVTFTYRNSACLPGRLVVCLTQKKQTMPDFLLLTCGS